MASSPAKRAKGSSLAKPPSAPAPEEETGTASEDPVVLLRRRWELASVLNFLRVFQPVIEADLKLSAEEIEMALASNNRDLARIHIALLKGIPPVNKHLNDEDGWIIVTAKKLTDWWSWVAEGANPFESNPGKEVETYKQQDPIKRLLILKALCEVRSEQNDAVWYVSDEMKKGTHISNFRKDKLGSGSNGTIYWYDGDSTIGHRLYTEDVMLDFKQNWKGKGGRLTKPVTNIYWETVATNLDEFVDISEKLSRKGRAESAIAEHLKTEIVPAVEKFQKKKERDLKRQEKKDKVLAFANTFQTRSLRERRRPVSYNFSDYDRSIDEAIRVVQKGKVQDSHEAGTKEKRASHHGDKGANGRSDINSENNKNGQEDAKYLSDEEDRDYNDRDASSGDEEDRDYNDRDASSADSDGENNASDSYKSDMEEEDVFVPRKRTRLAARLANDKPRAGLRRSRRNMKNDEETMHPGQVTPPPMTKKTLRQRPTPVSKQADTSFSGSEDDLAKVVADSEDEPVSKQRDTTSSGSEDDLAQVVADSEDESE